MQMIIGESSCEWDILYYRFEHEYLDDEGCVQERQLYTRMFRECSDECLYENISDIRGQNYGAWSDFIVEIAEREYLTRTAEKILLEE